MKILIFSHEFPPQIGGAGVVAEEYATCLSSTGHDVTVLTQLRKNALYSGSYKILQVQTLKKLWFFSYRKAAHFDSYDLIILNDVGAAYTAGLLFSKELLSKSIMLLHGSEPETIFLKPSLYRKYTLFKQVYKRTLNSVSNVVAVSHFMKEKFLKYTKLDYLSEKTIVIHNFINHDVFYPKPNPLFRESLGLPADAFILVSASRLVLGKGYEQKISLFKKLTKQNNRNLYWLIVGDGEDAQKIKEMVKVKGLNDRILFLGAKPRKDLADIFSNSDLFWTLSNFEESLGLVYFEAQACGCPAIARNAAGAREAILDGKTGYLVDKDEQVIDLFSSKEFLKFDCSDMTIFAKQFSCDTLIKNIYKLNCASKK